jgi:hypothetical protein
MKVRSLVTFSVCALSLAACGSRTEATAPSAPPTTASSGSTEGAHTASRPDGPLVLRKGESHRIEIRADETHEWGIDLAAGEHVTLSIRADSAGAPACQAFLWGFYNPSGGALREEPSIPSETGHWESVIEQEAVASIVEGPVAGRYLVRVAVGGDCPVLHYTLGAQ